MASSLQSVTYTFKRTTGIVNMKVKEEEKYETVLSELMDIYDNDVINLNDFLEKAEADGIPFKVTQEYLEDHDLL